MRRVVEIHVMGAHNALDGCHPYTTHIHRRFRLRYLQGLFLLIRLIASEGFNGRDGGFDSILRLLGARLKVTGAWVEMQASDRSFCL